MNENGIISRIKPRDRNLCTCHRNRRRGSSYYKRVPLTKA